MRIKGLRFLKNAAWLFVLAIGISACKPKDYFIIRGTLKNAEPSKKVYLFGMLNNKMVAVDSTNLSEKGEFKFIHSSPTEDFYQLKYEKAEYLLICNNTDEIKFEANAKDPNMAYTISGPEESDALAKLNVIRAKFSNQVEALQTTFNNRVADHPNQRTEIQQALQPQYEAYVNAMNNAILKFAKDNKGTLASFYAMSTLNPQDFEAELVKFADEIKTEIKGNPTVDAFVQQMALLKAVQVGQPAPAFTINNVEGKPVSLSDFKGKFVLIDFWASWCQPCRQENPNVVKVYNKFKDKNFDILGISLDTDKAAWQNAIKADGLAWHHVSELKDFNGTTVRKYQVDAIPSSFLVNPEGIIVAKNLRGEQLDAFLTKTIK
ncbi:peroxiredoxin [Pedobacter sp. UYP30]|uniref:AhpC/TSA family protein n=1 Tax=Pedobacter sp. UYP30 TaxID=1756400 RepID=UPI003393E399